MAPVNFYEIFRERLSSTLKILRPLICRALFVRVRRVQLYPSIWGNGCMHPSIVRTDVAFRLFYLNFSANGQILYPLIEIINKVTDMWHPWLEIPNDSPVLHIQISFILQMPRLTKEETIGRLGIVCCNDVLWNFQAIILVIAHQGGYLAKKEATEITGNYENQFLYNI